MEENRRHRRLRFGVFEVDPRAGELRKQGLQVRLQEQPFQVLVMLLEHPGEVVTREELRKHLWAADTFVDFDHGLNKAVAKLREALGDSAQSSRFVETVARRGYRFLAEVKLEGAAPAAVPVATAEGGAAPTIPPENASSVGPQASPASGRRSAGRAWAAAGLALLLAGAALAAWRLRPWPHSPLVIRSLAILPLENLSGEASQEYFADGVTDELIADLGQLRALRVISRTSAMTYKRARRPLPQIARELDVDAVVEGTVRLSGEQVRITAQLIQAATDRHLWSQSYEGDLRDALALQKKVARAIADRIRISLNPAERAALGTARTVDAAAYEAYLKGRYFWNKRTADGLRAALGYFDQAIAADPGYAQAYSGLADTYALLGDWEYAAMPPRLALPRARAAATRALELDGDLAEAHNSLAFCLDTFDWDFDAAGREFRRAIELNPGYATAHHWYAWHLSLMGQPAEAILEMRKAERLDPLSLIITTELAELLTASHAYEESIRQSRQALELDPDFALAHNQLGEALLQEHRPREAVRQMELAVRLSGRSPVCVANLARAHAAAGERGEAERLLRELLERAAAAGYPAHAEVAAVYASLGDQDRAMRWLEKGFDERFNPSVLLRPGFDPLRSTPRFQALLRRIGLPH